MRGSRSGYPGPILADSTLILRFLVALENDARLPGIELLFADAGELFVRFPDATASTSSKISAPTSLSVTPSSTRPAFTSMSGCCTRYEPEARAATGREHDDRAAARDLARHGDGVVARRVHVHESAPGDPLGVPDDLIERCRAGLRDRAERLLVDRRQAAGLVPGRWIVVDRGTEGRRMPLPPPDALEELARDLRAARSAREQMLSTVDLRGLAEDDRSPLAHLDPRASWSLLFRRALRTRCTGSSPHPPGREGWRRHDAPAPGRRPGRCPR